MAVLSVVCIDDEQDVLDVLTASAESTDDFRVVGVARDASEAFGVLRQHHPDVVVLDHGLGDEGPVIDLREGGRGHRHQMGLELVEVIRSAVPEATIVLFTGWHGMAEAAQRLGIEVFLEKPNVEGIWPAVRRARQTTAGR